MSNRRWFGLGFALPVLLVGITQADQGMQMPNTQPGTRTMAEMKFAGVPMVPTCMEASIQKGDPAQSAFTGLLKLKQGCTIPWHWHSANEELMFVDGTARMEMKDEKAATMKAGTYSFLPAKHVHQLRCTSKTCTVFMQSDAKFDIHYVDAQGTEIPPEEAVKAFKETVTTAMKEPPRSRVPR